MTKEKLEHTWLRMLTGAIYKVQYEAHQAVKEYARFSDKRSDLAQGFFILAEGHRAAVRAYKEVLQKYAAVSITFDKFPEQDDDTTPPVQADEHIAEPDQLSCDCVHWRTISCGRFKWCADCGKSLAG